MHFVPLSTTSSPVRTAAAKAVLWSLGLHLGGIAAVLALEAWLVAWITPAQFGGERVVIHVAQSAAAESRTAFELPAFEVKASPAESEQAETDSGVVAIDLTLQPTSPLTPREVVPVERQTAAKALVDLFAAAEPPRATEVEHVARPAMSSPSPSTHQANVDASPSTVAKRIARQNPAHRAISSAVAAEPVPQSIGVDEEIDPDLSGNRKPEYPPQAYLAGIEGRVLLRLHIAATGHVEQVEIVQSSGHAILDRAAVEAVSSWRGRPARRGDRPVPSTQLLPVRFQLR